MLRRVKQTRREADRTTPLSTGGGRVVKIDRARLAELVKERADTTLRELFERLGGVCTDTAVCVAFRTMRLSYKQTLQCTWLATVRCMHLGGAIGL